MAKFETRYENTRFIYLSNAKGTTDPSPIEKASVRESEGTFIIWIRDRADERRHSIMLNKSDIANLREMLDLIEKEGKQ
jgi:pyridoxine 5'-phosphate synthase PdxJ